MKCHKAINALFEEAGLEEDGSKPSHDPKTTNPKVEALGKMRTSALVEIITEVVAELERRADAQTVFESED